MQKRHYEKKCEDMAYRLRETEKSLQALQKEVASYRVNNTQVLSPSLTNLHLKNEKACNCDNLRTFCLLFFPIFSSFYFPLTFLSPFLTISLNRASHYFSHPVFTILCHVLSQSVFLQVSLYFVPPSLFRSTSAPSPRNFQA